MARASSSVDLTTGSIWRGIVRFALPIMASNLFQQLYQMVDAMVVGKFDSSRALAAVGSVGSFSSLLVGLFLGLSTGAGVVAAVAVGANDHERQSRTAHTGMLIAVFGGIFLAIAGLFISRPVLILMHFTEDTIDLAETYLKIYFVGAIPMLIYNMGSGLLRAAGDSRRPFRYLLAGGILNCVLDVLFVAVFKWSVAGAAWATTISQALSAALVLIHMFRADAGYRLSLRSMRYDRVIGFEIIKIGVPAGLASAMFSISNILIQAKINLFGTAAMAGIAAYGRIDGYLYMIQGSFGMAAMTFTGQNIGAQRMDRVRRGAWTAVLCAIAGVVPITALLLIFGPQALSVFTDDPEVIGYGLQMMHYMAPFAWVFVFAEVLGGVIRGSGASVQTTVITALNICVFRMLVLYLVMPFWYDIRLVFLCYPVSWALCSACFVAYYFKGGWSKKNAAKIAAASVAQE